MSDVFRTFFVELRKLERTPALMLALVAPYAVVVLQAIVVFNVAGRVPADTDFWLWFGSNCMVMWTVVLMPLFIALEAALLADLEHRHHTFKHLFALPTRRWAFYTAKLGVTTTLLALGLALMGSGIYLAGKGLQQLDSTLHFDRPFPLALWFEASLLVLVAGLAMVAIHVWISQRGLGFATTLGLAILATITAGVVLRFDEGLWLYFPWALPARIFSAVQAETVDASLLWFGGFAALLLAVLGAWDVGRRDVLA